MSAFIPPKVGLDVNSNAGIRTLPDLVDFHGKHNLQHTFCIQATRDQSFVSVSYGKLQRAVVRCQARLKREDSGLHPPTADADGHVTKCAPVAILTESQVGLVIYVLACMGMGVPVVLLSARLSSSAVRHLLQETGARLVIASSTLQALASEAISTPEWTNEAERHGGVTATIGVAAEWEKLLEEVDHAVDRQPAYAAHATHFVSEQDRQVVILHSSGTSGLPKPIPCSHKYFLGYATCHAFASDSETHGLTISTLPLFHGFGFVAICLSLGAGKTVCIPPPSVVPDGASVVALLEQSGARALLTVPSVLEEIEGLPQNKGHEALARLDFVGFGGGMPKESVGQRLQANGIRLIGQYGATETGPMTPLLIPGKEHNWRRLRLRRDTLEPLRVRLDRVEAELNQSDQHAFTYRLSMVPFGWTERFELQDLIVTTTEYPAGSDISQLDFTVAGRTDDLICLATGEKVKPTILESLLRQHDGVKDATAFGEGQFEIGVIIETADTLSLGDIAQFKATVWPVIKEAGWQMDAHAKITSLAAVLVVSPGDLPRSDKGTILRKAVTKKYAEEISAVYRTLEVAVAPALDLSSSHSSIRALVAESTGWQANYEDDFFAQGMDSLQATKLRRLLKGAVQATHSELGPGACHVLPVANIADDFVYRHPSINSIADALLFGNVATNVVDTESQFLEQLVEKYTSRKDHPIIPHSALSLFSGSLLVQLLPKLILFCAVYLFHFIASQSSSNMSARRGKRSVVVLTGATGSLGSFFLAQLLSDDSVNRVICLNRSGKEDALQAQKSALDSRNILVNDDAWAKVEAYQTDTASQWFGLKKHDYESLATEVTHIVHIAWPMNFKMGLQSYDSSFKSLQYLLKFAREARSRCDTTKPRLLFISSISTVGNYSLLSGQKLVPEVIPDDPALTLNLGYAKAKLVCEKMIQRAANKYPEIEVGVVRVGQIAGASSGYWNSNEHFVAVCTSSQKMGKFPDLRGTLSWLPVDSAAQALSEILFHRDPLQLVYHLENPTRQSWEHTVTLLSKELQIPSSSIVALDQWLDHIQSAPGPDNPAASLIQFLRNDFLKMSCGSVILDTTSSRSVSQTMAHMDQVGDDYIRAYVNYWKSIKLLQ
ncbi:NRPS-like enzyme [Penicillium hordei]|uniref:NRPS-like enzyme n=1 Tax=Penicillium hordei TaxID=40994 RepID=A0AAD6E1C5_9EURO|nr:NRPS-like enzyme [Penicillium hordei]KAJ5598871.1 NRPS-like enzyme [Penicillium hordei]